MNQESNLVDVSLVGSYSKNDSGQIGYNTISTMLGSVRKPVLYEVIVSCLHIIIDWELRAARECWCLRRLLRSFR